jgi:hypothetical protein
MVPYGPYTDLKKNLGKAVSAGVDWPTSSNKTGYYNVTDLPLVEASNWQTFANRNFPAPRAVREGAYRYYRRVIFLSLTLVYSFLAASLA